MTHSARTPRLPGTLLLKAARIFFDEATLSSVVYPAIADLQQEVRDAGPSRTRRYLARWRGYRAFAVLVVIAPFAFARSPVSGHLVTGLPEWIGGATLVLLVTVLFASTWPFFGWFMTGAVIGGVFLAVAMRWWHNRHPSLIAQRDPVTASRIPEINLSSIPVAGNVGGLIFAAGSVVIVILGLPELRWFFLAAVGSGVLVAAGLFAWRRAHPTGVLPGNSLVAR